MGNRTEDLERFKKIAETAQKMKKVMDKKGLSRAKAPCPFCKKGFLYGTLGSHGKVGTRGARRYMHLSCTTPKCTTYME